MNIDRQGAPEQELQLAHLDSINVFVSLNMFLWELSGKETNANVKNE